MKNAQFHFPQCTSEVSHDALVDHVMMSAIFSPPAHACVRGGKRTSTPLTTSLSWPLTLWVKQVSRGPIRRDMGKEVLHVLCTGLLLAILTSIVAVKTAFFRSQFSRQVSVLRDCHLAYSEHTRLHSPYVRACEGFEVTL